MVGKYVDLSDSYKSVNEALRHAGMQNHVRVKIDHVDSKPSLPKGGQPGPLRRHPGARRLWPARRGRQDQPARYAREHKDPHLGICLGMQVATIEYARHVAGLEGANSTEFDPDCKHPVIALINEWKDADGSIQTRSASSDLGGTMRLGAQSSDVEPGTLAHSIYGDVVTERHRHRYEANKSTWTSCARAAGLVIPR